MIQELIDFLQPNEYISFGKSKNQQWIDDEYDTKYLDIKLEIGDQRKFFVFQTN